MTPLDLRPLSVGEILDRSFTLYRRHFVLFIGIAALPQLLSLTFQLTRTFATAAPNRNIALAFSLTAALLMLIGGIITIVASLFSEAATFLAVSDLYLGRTVSISDCLRRAWSEIGTVFVVGILTAVAFLAGCIALIVPGIYIFCRLLVSVPAALIERRSASDAMSRSWRLEENNVGRAFVVVAVYFVISVAATMLFQLPFTIAALVYRNNFAMLQVWTAITIVGNTIISSLVSPIFHIAISVFYFDLRVRKEGFDLQFMMDPTSERLTPPGSGSVPSILG
ncbi:MAG: glycerophosphoryl diester phosphodiesterase membrane domain-containing protein [Acidobacteriaceae bacterium]|nr:glycerophosphoryl diester phosphodiesterase membrane domain-containing protein [Acidobacteriaceae bacterium]